MSTPTTPPSQTSATKAQEAETPLHLSLSNFALSLSQNPRSATQGQGEDLFLQEGMLDGEEGEGESFEGREEGGFREETGERAEEGGKEFRYTGSMGILDSTPQKPPTTTTTTTNPPSSSSPPPSSQDPIDPTTYTLYDTALLAQEGELSHEERNRAKELREERDLMRVLNGYLRGANEGLEKALTKIEAVEETLGTTHALLDLYVRMSSQAEHTQQLILDGQWGGVTKDIEALQQQEFLEAQEASLRQAEAAELEARAAEERANAASLAAERERKKSLSRSEGSSSVRRGAPTPRGRGLSSSVRGTSIPSRPVQSSIPTSTTNGPSLRGSTDVPGVRGVRGLRSRVLTRGTGSGRGRGIVD